MIKAFTIINIIIASSLVAIGANAATVAKEHAVPKPDVDWDSFSFSLNGVRTDSMWVNVVESSSTANDAENFSSSSEKCLKALGPLELSPAATVLNYGQALFEGRKAFRHRRKLVHPLAR